MYIGDIVEDLIGFNSEFMALLNTWIPKSSKKRIRDAIFRGSPVLWANLGRVSFFLSRVIPIKSPPLLIISMPRSGSSWVGDVMGLSSTSLYLREPLNQTYKAYVGDSSPSVFEIVSDGIPATYRTPAAAAFAGLPVFQQVIIQKPRQWSLLDRPNRRVVIKEVNPLAINWIKDKYKPRIIYLIRHPAAVANSYHRLRWINIQFERSFSLETLSSMDFDYSRFTNSFWSEFGAFQSFLLQLSLDALKEYPDYRLVKYEDLCSNPVDYYRELYNFAGLNWNSEIEEQVIARSRANRLNITGQYSVYRNSLVMIDKWKSELSRAVINEIKESYLFFNPPFYGAEEW